jgi:predicted RNA-binding protein with PIN domain
MGAHLPDHRRNHGKGRRSGVGGQVTRCLVDGMNVIGSRPDRWWNDPDKAVRRLIDELDRYAEETREEVMVVFDHQPRDVSSGMHGEIRVAFASRRGRNAADHEIAEMVAEDESPATLHVVTSDRDLADRVRQRGARVTSSGAFRRRLDETLEGPTA